VNTLAFSGLLFLVSYGAGLLGSLTGVGGGVVLVPVLILLCRVNIHYAMGASLMSVIATSSGAHRELPRTADIQPCDGRQATGRGPCVTVFGNARENCRDEYGRLPRPCLAIEAIGFVLGLRVYLREIQLP
jgi:hypothetical protein